MIAADDYVFQMFKHKYFNFFCSLSATQPLNEVLIYSAQILYGSLWIDEGWNSQYELSQANCMALTTDLWSSCNAKGYKFITVHSIDTSWNLVKHVILFKELPSPHTGAAIADWLLQSLVKGNSITKSAFITLDNVFSNNMAATQFWTIVLDAAETCWRLMESSSTCSALPKF